MPTAGRRLRERLGRAVPIAMTLLLAATLVAACGDEEETSTEQTSARSTEAVATAEPPAETAAEEDETSRSSATTEEREETRLVEDEATATLSCPDVVITSDSGNGLFGVEARGITCEDAVAALQAWGEAGFPGDTPPGFGCQTLSEAESGSTRLRCEQEASGAVVMFDTGG